MLCDDCIKQGFHNGSGIYLYFKYFCCTVCGHAQPDNKRAKDARRRLCNKCWNKKQRTEKLKKEGYAGMGGNYNRLVKCSECRELKRFDGKKTKEEL